jgi:hypothetical protein
MRIGWSLRVIFVPPGDGGGARRHRRDASGAAAEQVGAHHAEGGEDEQPEQEQEPEAEDLQDDLAHATASLARAGTVSGAAAPTRDLARSVM